jgi:hypothetical protein
MGCGGLAVRDSSSAELDYIYLHPFTDPLPFAVLRYTVPVTGMYTVKGAFTGRCCATTDIHLLFNDAPAISGTVTGYSGPPQNTLSFSLTRLLMANDIIDFAVGDGGNGYCCDSTGVRATIVSGSDIPEPGPVSLVLGGLAALLCRSDCRSGARRCRARE